MDNFFQQFKDNLDNQPEPNFEEKDWLSLSEKLKPEREKRPLSMWLLWCLMPLFLMSLLSNYFFYNEMKKAQQTALLDRRLDAVEHKTIVFQTDTIYTFQTIYERDTIYRTNNIYVASPSILPSISNALHNPTAINMSSNAQQKTEISETKQDTNFLISKTNNLDNILIVNDLQKLNKRFITPLPLEKQIKQPILGYLPIVENHHKMLWQRLDILRPKDYSVGISAGLVFPFGEGLSRPSGYALGLNGAMIYSKNMSIWADAQYMQLGYKVDKMGDAIGVPIVPPPSNMFNFNGAFIKQPTIQYMAGIRYLIEHHKHGQPYICLGFGAVTSLPYEVSYEFKNNSLGTTWDFDQKVNRKGTQLGFLLLEAGFEKRLSKQYRWQIGANYRVNLSTNDLQRQRVLGLKSGISYQF